MINDTKNEGKIMDNKKEIERAELHRAIWQIAERSAGTC